MVSVPRKSGPLPTVAYVHGTSISFYDVPSNPNTFGDFNPRGESFEGPPSTAVFAGNGFIYVAPDYLGLGGSTVPRHRYFHAATEASSAIDLLAAAQNVLADLKARQNGQLFVFGFSQGGHSALALHRELERTRVKVEGTAVVGGVFDVERWFLTSLENETTLFQGCTPPTFSSRSMTSTTSTNPTSTCSAADTPRSSRIASTCGTSSTTWRPSCRRPRAIC